MASYTVDVGKSFTDGVRGKSNRCNGLYRAVLTHARSTQKWTTCRLANKAGRPLKTNSTVNFLFTYTLQKKILQHGHGLCDS